MNLAVIIALIALSAVLLLWIIFIAAPAYCMYSVIFGKGKCRPHETTNLNGTYYEPYQDEIRSKIAKLKDRITKSSSMTARDGTKLVAEIAESGQKKTAILIHGYRSSPMNNCYDYGNLLYEHGYDLIMPHQRAHGKSEGRHSTFGLCEQYDLLDWLAWAQHNYPENDIVIVGISMGATTAALSLDKIESSKVKAVILDCGFTSPMEQMKYDCRRRHIPLVVLPLIKLLVKLSIKQDVNESTIASLSRSNIPLLLIHGTGDESVPCEFSRRNYEASSAEQKELVLIEAANHTLALTAGGKPARQKVIEFLK